MQRAACLAGMACALAAGAFFMLAATWAAMPVSTTHAIVGEALAMPQRNFMAHSALCVKPAAAGSSPAYTVGVHISRMDHVCNRGAVPDKATVL